MDYAILGNTYSDQNINYLTQGTSVSSKAAKFAQNTKRPVLVNNWKTKRPNVAINQISNISKNDIGLASEKSYSNVLSKLDMVVRMHDDVASLSGSRKIKTVVRVPEKLLKVKENSEKEPIPKVVEQVNTLASFEPKIDNIKEDTFENHLVSDTRMSRLERTGEVPTITNDVINAPERFMNNSVMKDVQSTLIDEKETKTLPSRTERNDYANSNDYQEKVEVGKVEKDLDRIASLNHSNNISGNQDSLKIAMNNYEKSLASKNAAYDEMIRLQKAVAAAEEAVRQQRENEIADYNAKTKANDDERLEYTMHSEDLRQQLQQLEELRRQLASGRSK